MTRHVSPREMERLAERERIRSAIENRIEAWIALLDRLDGDPDLEPYTGWTSPGVADDAEADSPSGVSDDEPSLGWTPLMNQERAMRFTIDVGTHEAEFGGDVADPENEPSLGAPAGFVPSVYVCDSRARWPAFRPGQERWAQGGTVDFEDINEDGGDILDERHDEEPDEENGDERDEDADGEDVA